MFVDSRVAHGRAKFELNRSPRMFADERRGKLTEIVTKSLDDFTGAPTRRSLMRMLSHQVAPKLERLGLEPYVGSFGNSEGLYVNFATMSAEHGLREFQLQVTVPDLVLTSFSSTAIKPHAVARCMQRNGVMSLDGIERETGAAFVFARTLRALAQLEQWKQAVVPTANGLFVGDVIDNGDFHLKTYLRPSSNGRASRWSGVFALFSTMPAWTLSQIHDGSDLLHWMIGEIVALRKSAALAERFPFLLKPYESVDDPLDAAWHGAPRAAQPAASADARSLPPATDSNEEESRRSS
ncbi:hypothetical protein QYH69_30965 [Paraburkholderia sp. SARCC-3016]|uniref:hypothetical protein n=1 Tax=Paraburkholderia sp. SARCC-3016 TaxID=3058611 RepID=UPI0028092CD6|nr:hypothetical protein [Paraburkholderia sp. SARCC-3016]MDQ7981647.1 hypothetical protein [Paraburkholderia sp. SARCC-3016]